MSLSSFLLLPINVAIQEGLFGPKAPVPAARPRLGDFLGLSLGASTLVTPSVPWNWHTNPKTFQLENFVWDFMFGIVTRDCDDLCIFFEWRGWQVRDHDTSYHSLESAVQFITTISLQQLGILDHGP